MLTNSEKLTFEGNFNYLDFLDNKLITDCTLICTNPDNAKYEAHRIILANSAEFFYNSFTCGMAEESSRVVEITTNPGNVFPLILHWIYSGKISFESKDLLNVIEVACFYAVSELCNLLNQHLYKNLTPTNILSYFDQCYQENLDNAKIFLANHLARFLDQVDMEKLTEILDVSIYCEALSKFQTDTQKKISLTNSFLKDYKLSPEEYECMLKCFTPEELGNSSVQQALKNWKK